MRSDLRFVLSLLGLGALGVAAALLLPGWLTATGPDERPRSMMGSGFVNHWQDVAPQTWWWSSWLDLRVDLPAKTNIVIWNHGTQAMGAAPSCMGESYFPPPAIMRLERIAHTRIYYLCTKADQLNGPQAYFEARRDEILALVARFRAEGVPTERIFLAGQSGGAASAALALAAEPEAIGGAMLFALAWQGPGEGLRRGNVVPEAHDAYIARTLVEAENFEALLVAFENDAWNRPEDLAFLTSAHPLRLKTFVPGCGADHGGAFTGCAVEAVAEAVALWFEKRLPGG
ncbi:MAG: hypothetical protein AAGI34_14565 [Pseudomonadota bacterium]